MTFGLLLAVPAVALADQIANNVDATIDATVEQTSVQLGGPAGSNTKQVGYLVSPQNTATDGDAGCNLDGSTEKLVANVVSSDTSVATVSPSQVTFSGPGCGDTPSVMVTGVSPGTATITLTQSTNNTGGTFEFSTATFQVNVDRATSITNVSGEGTEGGSATLTAQLNSLYSGTSDLSGKDIEFFLNGVSQGTATTDANGVAEKSVTTLPASFTAAGSPYATAVSAKFAGVAGYAASGPVSGALTVNPACTPVSMTTQPTADTITYGDNASFTAAASGNPAPTVQWQKSTNNGTTWTNISGATSTTLSLTKPLVADSGSQYRAVFSNTCGSGSTATSDAATLTVNAKQITGSFTADNKVYDGGTSATVLSRSVTAADVVGSDVVTLTGGTASFADKNVGEDKTVTLTGATLGGADAANYSLTSVSTTTADITAKALTITGLSALNKVYDGNTTAQLSGTASLVGVVSINNVEDDVSLSGTASGTFNNALVGNNKPVTVSGLSLAGADAGNYSLTPLVLSANILPWTTAGFFAPVDMGGVYNTVKGGSTVPLKFELFAGGTELTDPASSVKSLTYATVNCDGSAPTDDIETVATGGTSLRYDSTSGQFIYNWKTPTGAGKCYRVTVTAQDGTAITAYFKMK
jgi:hypothetical protein